MTKKGKKRKHGEMEAVKKEGEKKRRKEGSGGGCASYLHLRLEIGEGGREVDLSPEYMESHLIMALKTLFGEVGAAIPFSVREVQSGKGSATETGKGLSTKGEIVIEVLDSGLDRLRAAATLQGTYQGQEACFTTIAVSSSFSPALKDNL